MDTMRARSWPLSVCCIARVQSAASQVHREQSLGIHGTADSSMLVSQPNERKTDGSDSAPIRMSDITKRSDNENRVRSVFHGMVAFPA